MHTLNRQGQPSLYFIFLSLQAQLANTHSKTKTQHSQPDTTQVQYRTRVTPNTAHTHYKRWKNTWKQTIQEHKQRHSSAHIKQTGSALLCFIFSLSKHNLQTHTSKTKTHHSLPDTTQVPVPHQGDTQHRPHALQVMQTHTETNHPGTQEHHSSAHIKQTGSSLSLLHLLSLSKHNLQTHTSKTKTHHSLSDTTQFQYRTRVTPNTAHTHYKRCKHTRKHTIQEHKQHHSSAHIHKQTGSASLCFIFSLSKHNVQTHTSRPRHNTHSISSSQCQLLHNQLTTIVHLKVLPITLEESAFRSSTLVGDTPSFVLIFTTWPEPTTNVLYSYPPQTLPS